MAASAYSWQAIAGHRERTKHVFHERVANEGVEAGSIRHSARFRSSHGSYSIIICACFHALRPRKTPLSPEDADWVKLHFAVSTSLPPHWSDSGSHLEAANDWRDAKDTRTRFRAYGRALICLAFLRSSFTGSRSWLHRFYSREAPNGVSAFIASKSFTGSAQKLCMATRFQRHAVHTGPLRLD